MMRIRQALLLLVLLGHTAVGLPEQTRGEEHSALVNGMEMFYRLFGDGEPLVLLHGFSNSGELWRPLLSDFGAHFRLIVPDLRGHGRSSNPSGEFTHRQAARGGARSGRPTALKPPTGSTSPPNRGRICKMPTIQPPSAPIISHGSTEIDSASITSRLSLLSGGDSETILASRPGCQQIASLRRGRSCSRLRSSSTPVIA